MTPCPFCDDTGLVELDRHPDEPGPLSERCTEHEDPAIYDEPEEPDWRETM